MLYSTKAEMLYHYPLFSFRRFPKFLKFAKIHAKQVAIDNDKKNWLGIYLDMIWCNFRYGAMDSRDYCLFDFYSKSGIERNKYFTKRRYFRLIKSFDFNLFSELMVKSNAYKKYSDFIKRDWIVVDKNTPRKTIESFINQHGEVLVKPNTGEQGGGIFKARIGDIDLLLSKINVGDIFLLEELVVNTDLIKQINSSSLNTLRIYTLSGDKGVVILAIMLRVGSPGKSVDNWGSGGIGYSFDVDTGICMQEGIDKVYKKYTYHPGSNIKMVGFRLPNFQELKDYVRRLANLDRRAKYVGWDIAMTNTGFELIEVNFPGGHDFLQAFGNPMYDKIKDYFGI